MPKDHAEENREDALYGKHNERETYHRASMWPLEYSGNGVPVHRDAGIAFFRGLVHTLRVL